MSVQTISFHPKSDEELRARVKLLGKLIGNVLLKHEKPEVFHAVESLRTRRAASASGMPSRPRISCRAAA